MAAGSTVKVFEAVETGPLVAVMVFIVPARVRVRVVLLSTPAAKFAVVAPVEMTELVVRVALPV